MPRERIVGGRILAWCLQRFRFGIFRAVPLERGPGGFCRIELRQWPLKLPRETIELFQRTRAFAKLPHGLGAPRQIANRGFERDSLPRNCAGHAGFAAVIGALAAKIAANAVASILKLSGNRRNVLFWAA